MDNLNFLYDKCIAVVLQRFKRWKFLSFRDEALADNGVIMADWTLEYATLAFDNGLRQKCVERKNHFREEKRSDADWRRDMSWKLEEWKRYLPHYRRLIDIKEGAFVEAYKSHEWRAPTEVINKIQGLT